MRIAFCIHNVPESELQRVEFYRVDLELLRSLGHNVDIVTDPRALARGYDVAFVWWWNFLWLWAPMARRLGIPVVVTGTFDLQEFERRHWLKKLLKVWGASLADRHVFVSEMEAVGVARALAIEPAKVRYSPHVVDVGRYAPIPGNWRSREPFQIMTIGWMRVSNMRRKMFPELLEAFAVFRRDVPSARLLLAGPLVDGGELLRARVREIGLEDCISIPGELTREQKIAAMQHCSVFSQVSRFEGFGVAIAEAMACGAPVLVSAVGAVPEVVGDAGAYASSLDVEGIVAGLRAIHRDYDAALERANRGVARIRRHFSLERRRSDFAEVLGSVAGARR